MSPDVLRLQSGTLEERIEAARSLRRTPNPEAFDVLVAALYEQNDVLICEAADALVALGGPAVRQALSQAADSWLAYKPVRLADGTVLHCRTHIGERRGSSLSLAFVRCHGDGELCVMLADPDELRRRHAAWVLGERRAFSASAALERAAASDPDEVTRSAAARALRLVAGADAEPGAAPDPAGV